MLRSAFLWASLTLAVLLSTPAASQPQTQPTVPDASASGSGPLTSDERATLHILMEFVQAQCLKTPDARYCDELRKHSAPGGTAVLQSPTAPTETETAAAIAGAIAAYTADRDDRIDQDLPRTDPRLVANGHGPGPAGSTIPREKAAAVSLTATSDTKTASVGLSFDMSARTHAINSLAITAQTPVGQGPNYQNVATLDGLTKATSIGLQYTVITQASGPSNSLNANLPEYQQACKKLLQAFVSQDAKANDDPQVQDQFSFCKDDLLAQIIDKDNKIPASLKNSFKKALAQLHEALPPPVSSLWMFSLNSKIGYEPHTYFNGVTLAKNNVTRMPFQFGAAATYVFDGGNISLTGSYNLQRSYNDGGTAGNMQTLCPPTGAPVLKCINGYIGAPTETTKHLLEADLRYISPPKLLPIPVGIEGAFTYDAGSGVYGFQVPVYLVANTSKNLTGGIRYDWTSDKHISTVGVFVASAFCVLPGYSGCVAAPKDQK